MPVMPEYMTVEDWCEDCDKKTLHEKELLSKNDEENTVRHATYITTCTKCMNVDTEVIEF